MRSFTSGGRGSQRKRPVMLTPAAWCVASKPSPTQSSAGNTAAVYTHSGVYTVVAEGLATDVPARLDACVCLVGRLGVIRSGDRAGCLSQQRVQTAGFVGRSMAPLVLLPPPTRREAVVEEWCGTARRSGWRSRRESRGSSLAVVRDDMIAADFSSDEIIMMTLITRLQNSKGRVVGNKTQSIVCVVT